jgi:hypothetical protein
MEGKKHEFPLKRLRNFERKIKLKYKKIMGVDLDKLKMTFALTVRGEIKLIKAFLYF